MFVDINNLSINYLDEGDKVAPCLLLLHGWGCNCEVYRIIIDRLSAHFRVIAPDLPGFGRSSEPPEPWGVGDYVRFVRDFCFKLRLENVTFFGHSLGGRIIIKLLASQSGFTIAADKVILTGAAGIKPRRTFTQRIRTSAYKTGKFMMKPFPKLLLKLQSRSGSADYRAASPMMRGCLVKIVNEDLMPLLCDIKNDVLLIWGANDDSTPLSDGRLMERLIPNAGLAVIENAGHYAFLDRPELFFKITNSYLGVTND